MKEIKFRAWDNVENKMIYVGEDRDYSFEVTSTGIVCTKLGENPFDWETLDHLKYMHYTGLTDKKGNPIYEGDILQPSNNEKSYYTVVWAVRGAGFMREYKFFRKYQGKVEVWEERTLLPIYPDSHKVIGNIYENPELVIVE